MAAILVASPKSVFASVSPSPKTRLRAAKQTSRPAAAGAPAAGRLARSPAGHTALVEGLPQLLAAVGEVSQQLASTAPSPKRISASAKSSLTSRASAALAGVSS